MFPAISGSEEREVRRELRTGPDSATGLFLFLYRRRKERRNLFSTYFVPDTVLSVFTDLIAFNVL